VAESRLNVVRHAERTSFPYHCDAFKRGVYTIVSPATGRIHKFIDSVVLPVNGKHPYMQICIAIDQSGERSALFFGEEYGFPTALLEGDRLILLYGDTDYLGHKETLRSHESILEHIFVGIYNRNRSIGLESAEQLPPNRQVSVGAANSLGHNLNNDMPALWLLIMKAAKQGITTSLALSREGFFDYYVANYCVDHGLACWSSLSTNADLAAYYWNKKRLFWVRPYGYGFNRNFLRKLDLIGTAVRNCIWINVRSASEERFSSDALNLTFRKSMDILRADTRICNVVFDGLTAIGGSEQSPDYHRTIAEQNVMVRTLSKKIRELLPLHPLQFTNLVGRDLMAKIYLARGIRYFVGTFGSGTWPLLFSDYPIAYVLLNGQRKYLKTDPSYDFTRFEDQSLRYVLEY